MGIYAKLVSGDQIFRQRARNPIIINDYDSTSESDQQRLNELIYTSHEGASLSSLPSCGCGKTTGEHHIHSYNGVETGTICQSCDTEVTRNIEHTLNPIIWIRAPKKVQSMINPHVWIMMRDRLSKSGVELVRWICDTSYVVKKRNAAINELEVAMMDAGLKRGLNNFVKKFEDYLEILFGLKSMKTKERFFTPNGRDPLHNLLLENRDNVFWQHVPLPNRTLLLIEKTDMGTFVDDNIKQAVDAVNIMKGIDSPFLNYDERTQQNRAVKTISVLADFYRTFYMDTLAKKPGIFRKQIFGFRSHWSFRSVITSLTDRHDYDEIHISWSIGIALFREHLVAKLLKMGYRPNEATKFINAHAHTYNGMLDAMMKWLIAESPWKTNGPKNIPGVPVLMQRNPSLERGSAQLVYITHVKEDPEDMTVSIGILTVVGMNADFDGDQINFTMAMDNYVTSWLKNLSPHKSTFGLTSPYEATGNLALPKPVTAAVANHYMPSVDDYVNQERVSKLSYYLEEVI